MKSVVAASRHACTCTPAAMDPRCRVCVLRKGEFDGECNRTACRAIGVRMWSAVEHAYYCVACSRETGRWSSLVGVKPMVLHTADGGSEHV